MLATLLLTLVPLEDFHVYPWENIQPAIDQAQDGDRVLVHGGGGHPGFHIDSKDITVMGVGLPLPVISGAQGAAPPSLYDTNSVVEGFNIRLHYTLPHWGFVVSAGLFIDNDPGYYATIRNCLFYGNDQAGGGGIVSAPQGGAGLEGCVFRDNIGHAVRGAVDMRYCYVTNTEGAAIVTPDPVQIESCTFSANNFTVVHGPANVVNSIFWGNRSGLLGGGAQVSFSCLQEMIPGRGNIYDYPQFLSHRNSFNQLVYSLKPTSPCVDAGDPFSRYLDPDGSRVDMGAYPLSQRPSGVDAQPLQRGRSARGIR